MNNPQQVINHLVKVRQEILTDERMTYKTAEVFSNAPLALIQMGMSSQLGLIETALGLPATKLPIKK